METGTPMAWTRIHDVLIVPCGMETPLAQVLNVQPRVLIVPCGMETGL